jgi:ankyrin repeat protein
VSPYHLQVDAVAFLLSQRGIKTNLGTEANWTPLHVACEYSNADKKMKIMSLLLSQKGTNPNIQNTAGTHTPVLHSSLPPFAVVPLLLTLVLGLMLVAFTASPGFTPLHMCAKKHDLEGVRLLLEYNANPDIKDNKGWTPLSIAYSEKQQKAKLSSDAEGEVEVESEQMDDEEEVMHCLIEAGANPNQLSFTSRTSPLFEACRVGMERRAEVLIGTIRPLPSALTLANPLTRDFSPSGQNTGPTSTL